MRDKVASIIHDGMEQIGIEVDYELIEFGDLVGQLTASYDWEAMVIGFTGGPDPYGGIGFWHSSAPLHLWNPNQPQPATEWEAAIDTLLKGSRSWTATSGWHTIVGHRKSPPRTCQSSTLHSPTERGAKRVRQHDAKLGVGHPLPVQN